MAASPYSSTEEQTNACRACRLLLGPCTDQFRDVLRHFVQPPSFQQVILRKTNTLPRLTATQMNLILPRRSSYTGNYSDMDISLLYILLRNICSIPPHSTGWGNAPDPADRSLSASIERIHTARYQCVVSSSSVLSDADFNTIWSTVRSAVVDIDSFLNNGNHYKSQVDVLRQETIDPVGDQHFIEELKKQIHENEPTKEILHDLQNKIEKRGADRVEKQNEMQRIVDEIKTPKSVIPPNVKDNHEKQIQQWVEEDKVFSKTHNFEEMLDKVRERPYLTFVGIPGSGKSATIQHISLILQKEGYEIVPIINIRKIEDYCDSLKPQVFVIDDVVGVLGLQKQKLNLLMEYEIQISNPSNKDTKVLMSCRETVFNECHSYKSFLTHEKTAVMLHSSENSLTVDDKKRILLKHGLDDKLLPDSLLRDTSGMFPLLCKLYSKEEKFRNNVERFFTCPVECILEELDKMQHQNKLYYATLVLCMFNDKKLSREILKNTENTAFHDMKSDVLENCEVESYTDAFKFDKALKAMAGTYTHLRGNEYSFVHDFIFEVIAYHFGCHFPDLILKYISSSYIANKVKVQKCTKNAADSGNDQVLERTAISGECKEEKEKVSVSGEGSDNMDLFNLCLRLKEHQYPMLAERLLEDVERMELFDVFRNKVLKEPKVCRFFIEILKKRSYVGWRALFLSELYDICNVVSKGKRLTKESLVRDERNRDWYKQCVLLNENCISENAYSVRVISWVIYYGHTSILQYIVKQTELHKETQSELFLNPCNPGLNDEIKQEKKIIETNNAEDNLCFLKSKTDFKNQKHANARSISEQYRLLVLSCYSGDLETVSIIIKHVNEITLNKSLQYLDYVFRWDDTPLTAACEGGYINVVKKLLLMGANVNLQGKYTTPLTAACESGHFSVVKELLIAGAEVNLRARYNKPLTAARENWVIDVSKELLISGSEVTQQGKYNTPLTTACKGGYTNIVKELLKAGADVNLPGEVNLEKIAVSKRGHFQMEVAEAWKYFAKLRRCNTPLIAACNAGHIDVVNLLIKAGADVNPQSRYNSPLIAACEGGYLSLVDKLLDSKADANLKSGGTLPLVAACKGGHVSIVKKLLKGGAEVNPLDIDNTPLKTACAGGYMNVVKELVGAGADINLRCGNTSSLAAACRGGHVEVVMELIQSGADVNLQGDFGGDTPLIEACGSGNMRLVEKLVRAGADVNLHTQYNSPLKAASTRGHLNVVKELIKMGAEVIPQGIRSSPLSGACRRGYMDIMNTLLEEGADVNFQGMYDYAPLIEASALGHLNLVKKLLEVGADVNQQADGSTPLTKACKGGHLSVVKELIEAGAQVNLQDECDSPLLQACRNGNTSVVEMLLKAGADVNIQHNNGTPLLIASENGHIRLVKELLKAGAYVNFQAKKKTPLTAACEGGHFIVMEKLLGAGADVNLQDLKGRTPLYIAVLKYTVTLMPIVKMLSKYGADSTICNKEGLSALYIALLKNRFRVVQHLFEIDNEILLNKLKFHLFDCLVKIRQSDVMTDSKGDVVVTRARVWRMRKDGDLHNIIQDSTSDVFRQLFRLGMNVNQWIELYHHNYKTSDAIPLLFTVIDGDFLRIGNGAKKLRILIRSGVDLNVRVRFRVIYSVIDKLGMSFLEKTRREVIKVQKSEGAELIKYKRVLNEARKHVRRYSQ